MKDIAKITVKVFIGIAALATGGVLLSNASKDAARLKQKNS